MKWMVIAFAMMFQFSAQAELVNVNNILAAQGFFKPANLQPMMLDWKVGDNAQYNLNMGFIQGTNDTRVREATTEGFWIVQDMKLGFAGDQLVEIHIHKGTGEILELRVNGQKQNPPDQGNMEVVEATESSVTVPAGTFDCVYLKVRDNDKNEESENWINPQIIPVMGQIKTIAPSPFGQVIIELTGYEKL